ncbi:MAG: hypothetical protein LBM66_04930, partial [Bifidobacteriaceae bacterium]|nr:hypothetical protein [Bifidobacteriaceae bacterium]
MTDAPLSRRELSRRTASAPVARSPRTGGSAIIPPPLPSPRDLMPVATADAWAKEVARLRATAAKRAQERGAAAARPGIEPHRLPAGGRSDGDPLAETPGRGPAFPASRPLPVTPPASALEAHPSTGPATGSTTAEVVRALSTPPTWRQRQGSVPPREPAPEPRMTQLFPGSRPVPVVRQPAPPRRAAHPASRSLPTPIQPRGAADASAHPVTRAAGSVSPATAPAPAGAGAVGQDGSRRAGTRIRTAGPLQGVPRSTQAGPRRAATPAG